MDIKDYFSSITETLIFVCLKATLAHPLNESLRCLKNMPPISGGEHYFYNHTSDRALRLMSEMVTYSYFLPQGAITSPKISNIVTASTFGPALNKYCAGLGARLDIYADDIIISFREKPPISPRQVVEEVEGLIESTGYFLINKKKTRVMTRNTRQWVCGVVVNEKTNLLRKERQRLRAILHLWETKGFEYVNSKSCTEVDFYNHLQGKIRWFKQLNPEKGEAMMKKFHQLYARDTSNSL